MADNDATAETPENDPKAKATDNSRAGRAKAKADKAKAESMGPVLLFHRKGNIYTCSHNEPLKGREAGTGVSAMKTTQVLVHPGANLIDREKYELIENNPGFLMRLKLREIVKPDKAWKDLPNNLCIEEAKKSSNLTTLADLLEAETREDVAQAIEATLELATRAVRKDKKHLTAIQVARMGRQR